MRKFISISLLMILAFLSGCNEKKVLINLEVIEYDEIVLESVEVSKGVEIQLPIIEQDWYKFIGWYKEQSYTTLVESITLDDDITLYGKYEPSLSIAVLGETRDIQYDEIIHMVEAYSMDHGRVYQIYDTSNTDPYDPVITLDAID